MILVPVRLLVHSYMGTFKNVAYFMRFGLSSKQIQYKREVCFIFLHIESYNKDIYNHIWCSAALFWWTVQSRELELSWKQKIQ